MIVEVLSIMAQLLGLMLLFAVIGRPLFSLLRRRVQFFEDFNIVQELVFDVYLGALLLYALALLPFHLFNTYGISVVLALCSAFGLAELVKKIRSKKLKETVLTEWRKNGLEQVTVLALFLLSLGIQVIPLTAFLFGSIHDTSLHALFSELILENGQIPATHDPYIPAAIVYPQGAHAIFAFATLVSGIIPPLAVFYLTPLFSALTTLAAYHFGKSLDARKYAGISFAFVLSIVSMWPTHMTWGTNTFVTAVPLFVIAATFLKHALDPEGTIEKHETLFYVAFGLFLGFLGAIYAPLLLILILAWIILSLVRCIRSRNMLQELKNAAILIAVSALLVAPFLFRFISYFNLPGQNIGLPADLVMPDSSLLPLIDPPLTLKGMMEFLLSIPNYYNISPYLITRLLIITLSLLASISILVVRALKGRRPVTAEVTGLTLSLASLLLLLMIPINPIPTASLRAGFMLYISLMLLIGSFNVSLWTWLASKIPAKTRKATILILLIFVSLYSPFIYYRLAEDPTTLIRQYNLFAVTTEDDYSLMLWMKDNLPQNSIILVNPFEAGLFIPAVSHRIVVYPFSAYHLSASYSETVFQMAEGTLNSEVFRYLKDHNITHIYVGSRASWVLQILQRERTASKWDPYLFWGNSNFKLAKKIGDAYLFEFRFKDPQTILADNFDYDNLDQGGWQIIRYGDGKGDATVVQDNASINSHDLMLCAKSKGEPYLTSVLRRIYLSDSFNVTLSLDLKSISGISPEDSLMLIISDIYRDNLTRVRLGCAGTYEFNLSKMWKDLHVNELLKSFYIEILNCDTDGIENVVCVESIAIIDGNARQPTSP
jgi:hypothetical protein